MKFHRVYC